MKTYPRHIWRLAILTLLAACAAPKQYESARTIDTIEAFEGFVAEYPKSKYADSAKTRLAILYDHQAYQTASSSHTVNSYQTYLEKYPEGLHTIAANDNMAELQEQEAWELAQQEDIPHAYQLYLNAYPEGKHASEAQRLFSALDLEFTAWDSAQAKQTYIGFMDFVKAYPKSRFAQEAKETASDIEEKAWQECVRKQSTGCFHFHWKKYPGGKYAAQSEKRYVDDNVTLFFMLRHVNLPELNKPLNAVGDTTRDHSLLHIKNDTGHDMVLFFSGPESRAFNIKEGQMEVIQLANGKYRTVATITAPDVVHYAGYYTLEGADYSQSFTIGQTKVKKNPWDR